jgi:prepilin-type N-terminal cleavage/methylation domain-containing protein/prepilin-type processing-associated H-X9-DG protein
MKLGPVVIQRRGAWESGWPAPHAFTLIEVLVVTGVIALLIAILLPSLARSREQTRAVACKSNLSQLGKALVLYANDYRSTLPYENRGEEVSEGRVCWFDAIDHPYLSKAKADRRVKICPTVALDAPTLEESYRMNSKLAEATESTDPAKIQYLKPYRKIDTLDRPGATVVLFDGKVGGQIASFKGRWRLRKDDVCYRHNVSTNLLFADWHAEGMHKNVLKAKSIKNSPVIWQPADVGPWDPDPQS